MWDHCFCGHIYCDTNNTISTFRIQAARRSLIDQGVSLIRFFVALEGFFYNPEQIVGRLTLIHD